MQIEKVIIIDDEEPARSLLNEYLSEFQQLQVISECRNGVEAIEKIDKLKPDLIFLDIQMPGKSGFEVLQEISFFPSIIFTTAYDEFALQAFEVSAMDYLLKPYTRERLGKAVDKVFKNSLGSLQNIELLKQSMNEKIYSEHFFVEFHNKLISVLTKEILWVEAFGDYTKIHTSKYSYISNNSLRNMEQKLNPRQFQRVHRSAIISLAEIKEVKKLISGVQVILVNETRVKVSRTYQQFLKNMTY